MDTPPGLLAALRRKLGEEPPVSNLPVTIKPGARGNGGARTGPARRSARRKKPAPALDNPTGHWLFDANATCEASAGVSGRYYVQIGAFAQRGNGDAAARKAGGTLVRAGNLWRARSGPFSTGTEAQRRSRRRPARRAMPALGPCAEEAASSRSGSDPGSTRAKQDRRAMAGLQAWPGCRIRPRRPLLPHP